MSKNVKDHRERSRLFFLRSYIAALSLLLSMNSFAMNLSAMSIKSSLSLIRPTSLNRSLSMSRGFGSVSPASGANIPSGTGNPESSIPSQTRNWNLKGLKVEVSRQQHRTFKKVGKARGRLSQAEEKYNEISSTSNPSLELLESCPNPAIIRNELEELQSRLQTLTTIEYKLKEIKSPSDQDFQELLPNIEALELSDEPPARQVRGPKKVKQKTPPASRMPYASYTSKDGIEIRVGRTASDNDDLSCNPELRDNNDWWLHASGCPGSHVVIRCTDDDLMQTYRETVIDAALLAAANSKKKDANRVPVNLTRCRYVSKPRGAKPGLVYLNGDVATITVDMKAEAERLDRLKSNR